MFLDKIFPIRINNSTKFNIITRSSQLIILTLNPSNRLMNVWNSKWFVFQIVLWEKRTRNLLTDLKLIKNFLIPWKFFLFLKMFLWSDWKELWFLSKSKSTAGKIQKSFILIFSFGKFGKFINDDPDDDSVDAYKVAFVTLISDLFDF